MAKVDNFEELDVWKLARALTGKVYRLSSHGAFAVDYGFRNQICRAAVSIVSNIAEGFERRSRGQFLQFLDIANGSAGEVRAQLYIALDLGYITQAQFQDALQDVIAVGKMLTSLYQYLKSNSSTTQPPNHLTTQPPNHLTT
jgi:four helix bundle protein